MQDFRFSLITNQPALEELVERAQRLIAAAKAPQTLKAYASDWRHFDGWCVSRRLPCLPSTPAVVALYIADCASRLAPSTIARRLASISKAHQAAGYPDSPAARHHFVIGEILKGVRRSLGVTQKGKDPLLIADIRKMIDALPCGLTGLRDGALLLVGFAGGFRRSEIAAIAVPDLVFAEGGVVVNLRRSKTDQEQSGRQVAIPFGREVESCPVLALRAWLAAAGIREGAVFRGVDRHGRVSIHGLNADSIAPILKRAAARAGMETANIAGHSVRAGLVTEAALNGVAERVIAAQTGHRSISTLRRYVRTRELFGENAARGAGL